MLWLRLSLKRKPKSWSRQAIVTVHLCFCDELENHGISDFGLTSDFGVLDFGFHDPISERFVLPRVIRKFTLRPCNFPGINSARR